MSFIFALISLFNLQAELFLFLKEPILISKQCQFKCEITVYWDWEASSFWKCELNFNTFVLFEGKAKEIYSAKFRNVNNYYANRHALLHDSLSKKTKIILANLTCNKKTYPLNCWRELKPNSSLEADKYHNKIEGITACTCKLLIFPAS